MRERQWEVWGGPWLGLGWGEVQICGNESLNGAGWLLPGLRLCEPLHGPGAQPGILFLQAASAFSQGRGVWVLGH